MKYSRLVATLALATCSSWASAGIIIDSINVKMANTNYTVSGEGADGAYASAKKAFDAAYSGGNRYCNIDLDSLTDIASNTTCGGSKRDFGALYTITGNNQGITEFRFGMDWGRGGFVVAQAGDESAIDMHASDIWWSRSWTHSDVLPFTLEEQGRFTLTLLGFEGCCDGPNSAQYLNRDLESDQPFTSGYPIVNLLEDTPLDGEFVQRAIPVDQEWQALEVNAVPLPGSLPLLAVGGLILWRRRSLNAIS